MSLSLIITLLLFCFWFFEKKVVLLRARFSLSYPHVRISYTLHFRLQVVTTTMECQNKQGRVWQLYYKLYYIGAFFSLNKALFLFSRVLEGTIFFYLAITECRWNIGNADEVKLKFSCGWVLKCGWVHIPGIICNFSIEISSYEIINVISQISAETSNLFSQEIFQPAFFSFFMKFSSWQRIKTHFRHFDKKIYLH